MADEQFLPLGIENAPADWVLPKSLEFILKACYAHFDGTGAAGAYVPTLELISDSGDTAWAIPLDAQVAAGSSVDASWASFRVGGTSGGGAAAGLLWAFIGQTGHTNCPAGVTTLLSATLNRFYTNAPTLYATANDGAGHNGISLLADGHYFSLGTVGPFGAPAANSLYEVVSSGGGSVSGLEMSPSSILFPAGGINDMGWAQAGEIMSVGNFITPPTAPIIFEIINSGPNAVNMILNGHLVFQLDTVNQDI